VAVVVSGGTWQQRWLSSGAEAHPGATWVQLPLGWLRDRGQAASYDREDLPSGLLMLICGRACQLPAGRAGRGDQDRVPAGL
jgi:hypothetical protein